MTMVSGTGTKGTGCASGSPRPSTGIRLAEAEPGLRRVGALHLGDVALGARVVPVAREPRADASPQGVGLAVLRDDLGDRLAAVEPRRSARVERPVETGTQRGAPVVGVERGVVLRVGIPAVDP